MKRLNKFQIIIMSLIQIIFIKGLIQDIVQNKINNRGYNTNNVYFSELIIMAIIFVGIYLYIGIKFWNIKKYRIYKIFAFLDILYAFNIMVNFFRIFSVYTENILIRVINSAICIFLIINLILILTYNKNIKTLEKSKIN